MILEYCQLLSTAHRVLDGEKIDRKWKLSDWRDEVLYSVTHINHPSAVWVRASNKNYQYLHKLLLALIDEYQYRYEKIHKCSEIAKCLENLPKKIARGKFSDPTPAMPKDCLIEGDVIGSYRGYYKKYKAHIASWKRRKKPNWY